MRVPVRFCAETALCGNAHLVIAPGKERQETQRGRRGGERDREDVMLAAIVSLLTVQGSCFHHEFTKQLLIKPFNCNSQLFGLICL